MVKVKALQSEKLCICKACFNHPMVKVKDDVFCSMSAYICFNHPMVKVKVRICYFKFFLAGSFNHPMVKVKGERVELVEMINKSFNHPMVKVKETCSFFISKPCSGFNHPMVKVKGGLLNNEKNKNLLTFSKY